MSSADPVIRVDDVVHPIFQGPDLDEMAGFLESFGMTPAARTSEALYMRGTDPDHHVHVTRRGEPDFLGLAFAARSEADLQALAAATGVPVEDLDGPGGGRAVHLRDPDDRIVDVVWGITPADERPVTGHPPLNTGADRVRVGELQRVESGPSQVKRFGHAALKTADLAGLTAWYQQTLGLLVSDEVWLTDPGEPNGRFMRCDRGNQPADHHTLLLVETGETKLGHCAWEVADFDDLMVGHDHLAAADARHYWGIGRHVLGGQIFDYWKDPLGFTVEHWTDSDLLTSAVPAGSYSLLDPINQWGPNPPEDLDF